ncbi:MAG: hypothetical protein QMD85_03390, partial [Candidatus Aenigmarchaeota archaeon]|nr:hypothetical protein [Candidatus Aenigmarchaeota archaeon]MDI6722587.1 hypothetical protein [Candidatus Aenigmarchaeota archaeon]
EDGIVRDAMPYIGKTTQSQRILFSDTRENLAGKCNEDNPSFEFSLALSDIYEALLNQVCVPSLERIYRLVSLGKDRDD